MAVAIQQIPAPPFGESQRAAFIYEAFRKERVSEVSIDEVGNVLAHLPGNPNRSPLIITAHMDTVFPLNTPLQNYPQPDRIYGPGIGDNSIGVASLFGLLWTFQLISHSLQLPADIWLIANVGEEGLGNLRGMRRIVEKFQGDVLAYLVIEGMGLGQIFHRALEIKRYRIYVKTPGGHSWVDFGRPSAINEIAGLINHLAGFSIPRKPRTSMNIGTISGGTSVNTIAAEAFLDLDLRSENTKTLDNLVKIVEASILNARKTDVVVSLEQIGHRPGGRIPASHPLVRLAGRCLKRHGIQPELSVGSTDANIPLSMKLPAICVGVTRGSGAHTTNEFIETGFLPQGLGQLVDLVVGALNEL
jgi:acetylornithine deacetylase/succinyl-diaminopimelate desuccinylase-like protein